MPHTGSLYGDIRALLAVASLALRHPIASQVIPDLLVESVRHPEIADAIKAALLDGQQGVAAVVVREAVERGELPAGADPDRALDLIVGPLYWRLVVVKGALPKGYLDDLAKSRGGGAEGDVAPLRGGRAASACCLSGAGRLGLVAQFPAPLNGVVLRPESGRLRRSSPRPEKGRSATAHLSGRCSAPRPGARRRRGELRSPDALFGHVPGRGDRRRGLQEHPPHHPLGRAPVVVRAEAGRGRRTAAGPSGSRASGRW